MQQTEQYKLNKPGVDDPIAIAPLNENMDKLEAALTDGLAAVRAEAAAGIAAGDAALTGGLAAVRAEAAAGIAAGDAALEQRIITLEGKHAVGGIYVGTGGTQTIQLGFTPAAVFVHRNINTLTIIHEASTSSSEKIVEGGFTVGNASGMSLNHSGSTYGFIAVG